MSAEPQPVAVPQGVVIRFAAYLIDVVAMSLPTAIVISIGYGRNIPAPWDLITNPPGWFLPTILVIQLAYFTILEGAFATTLGKKACGLRVVAVADWSKCGWVRAFLRNLLLPVDGYFYLPGVIAIVVTPRRQRIGDLLAGTTVVKFAPAAVAAAPASSPPIRQVAHVFSNEPVAPAAAGGTVLGGEAPDSGEVSAEDEPPVLETGWYRSRHGHQFGPCDWDELWDMAVAGTLTTDDPVWHESYGADWIPAGEVPELADAFASRPKA